MSIYVVAIIGRANLDVWIKKWNLGANLDVFQPRWRKKWNHEANVDVFIIHVLFELQMSIFGRVYLTFENTASHVYVYARLKYIDENIEIWICGNFDRTINKISISIYIFG